jgi:hypothetical protein
MGQFGRVAYGGSSGYHSPLIPKYPRQCGIIFSAPQSSRVNPPYGAANGSECTGSEPPVVATRPAREPDRDSGNQQQSFSGNVRLFVKSFKVGPAPGRTPFALCFRLDEFRQVTLEQEGTGR